MRKLNSTQRLFVNVVLGAIFIVFGVWIATSLLNPEQTKAAWFDNTWLYRQTVPITNSGSIQQNTQIPIVIDTATLITQGKMRSDCRDIRVTSGTGKLLKHWVHQCNSQTTKIYTWAFSLPAGNSNLFVYYGNSAAGSNLEVTTGTDKYPGVSCKTILDHSDSHGDGQYVIDPDAGTTEDEFTTYCDMTTDSGGWTIVNSSNGTINQQGLTSNTEVAGNPFNSESSNLSQQKKQDASLVSSESLIKRSNGKWLKVSVPFFDGNLTTASQHPHSTNVTLTADDGTTVSTAVAGYSNYNNSGGGDYGITTSVGFDHHNSTYYHLRSGCTNMYFYKYGTTYNVNTTLGSWTQSVACTSNSTALGPWYAGIRGTITPTVMNVSISSPTNEEYSPGPVGYWSMDEGSGSIVHDKTAIGSNGTISGATWQSASKCKVGKCLYFDGTNDSVDFGNISPRASISGDLTVSFWIKPTNIAKGRQNPLGKAYGGEFDMTMETNGSLNMYHGSAGNDAAPYTQITSPTLSQNQWTHVVYVRDTAARTFKVYFNGKQVKSQTYTSTYDPVASTRSFKFGYEYAGYYQGYLDEVMLFPTVKSQNEINALYSAGNAGVAAVKGIAVSAGTDDKTTLNQGLVGLWKMDETSWNGTTGEVKDSSGTGNDGTASNATASSSAKFGNASYFAGSNDSITIADATSLEGLSAMTLAAWINPSSLSGTRDIIQKENTYNFRLTTTYIECWIHNGTGYVNIARAPISSITTNTWQHVACTWKAGETGKIYVNGVDVTTPLTAATAMATNTQVVKIGSRVSNEYFMGYIDEARIYNRALSSNEMLQLYSYAPGPVAYYNFEEKSGNTINDVSGHGNNSTAFGGTPQWTQGKYGGGMYFDGSSYARVNHAITTTGDNTIAFWLKIPVQGASYYRILSDATNGIDLYFTGTGTNGLYGTIGNSTASWTLLNPNIADNQWHYISLVSSASDGNTRAYLDGKLQSTFNKTYSSMTLDDLYIGSNAGGSNYRMTGTIDELKIYNYSRTGGQVVEDMNASHPLGGSPVGSQVAYYKFDEGYGITAHNSGNGGSVLDGTINGGATWTNGKFGRALSFDGSNDTVTVPAGDNSALDGENGFTYSVWMKRTEASTSQWPILIGAGNTHVDYGIRSQSYGDQISFEYGKTPYDGSSWSGIYCGSNSLPINEWHQFTATYDGSTLSFYRDTKKCGSSITTSLHTTFPSTFYINSGGYKGLIDEVKIYSTALTAEQIKIDYNSGQSLKLGSLGTESDGKTPSNSIDRMYCPPGDTTSSCSPIAQYSFEEKSGTSVLDSSGNGNTATINSTPHWIRGKIGSGLEFDSGADYLSLSGISIGSTWTVTTWSKFPLATTGGYRTLVRQGSGIHHVLVDPSGLLGVYNGSFYSSGFDVDSLSPGWHYLTANGSGGSTVFYVDGRQVGTSAQQITSNITEIGNATGGNQNWGAIDEMRIYNYTLSPAQIAWNYNRGAAVARWKMDECQGSVIHDSSGNGADGTITIGGSGSQTSVGTCTTSSTAWGNGTTGKFNSSLNFDGEDDLVSIPNNAVLNPTDAVTISLWVKPGSQPQQYAGLVQKGTHNAGYYLRLFSTTNISFNLANTWSACVTSNSPLTQGAWNHLVAVYDGTNCYIYVNAKNVKTAAKTGAMSTGTSALRLGHRNSGENPSMDDEPYNGQMDDVQIFNYALTGTQIQSLYNQNSSVRYGPLTGSP